jgi:hypothetical protein
MEFVNHILTDADVTWTQVPMWQLATTTPRTQAIDTVCQNSTATYAPHCRGCDIVSDTTAYTLIIKQDFDRVSLLVRVESNER